MSEVKVLQIKGTDSFLIKKSSLENYRNYVLNGESLTDYQKSVNITISKKDILTYDSGGSAIIHYSNGSKIMTVEEYKAKPQYYDDESSDEQTLRAIANKKELKGYEPVKEKLKPEIVTYKISGIIEDTKSNFISCSLPSKYSESVLYIFDVLQCTMDEYDILRIKHSSHANFMKPEKNRGYLRFTKINNNYAFRDGYPFGDYVKPKAYLNLKQAEDEEIKVRGMVRNAVMAYVNKEQLSEFKKVQILNNLKLIKKLKTKASILDMINLLVKDLECVTNNE